MALLKDEERREKAASLKQFKTQAINTINVLKGIKSGLTSLKSAVTSDTTNFAAADATDVQSIIDFINTEIGKI